MKLLKTTKLGYDYPDGHCALRCVDFTLEEGSKTAVIGANGSGKSTLLLLLAGCLSAGTGEISLRGKPTTMQPQTLREKVGLVFQEPDDQMFMPSVLEDVAFGLVARGMEQNEAKRRAAMELDRFDIARLAERPPHRLSGGEKRVAALCGILVMRPEIVVLDEPSASLDPRARKKIIEVLRSMRESMIVATHDLDMALDLCDNALILSEGVSIASGTASDLLHDRELLQRNGLEPPLSLRT